MLLYLIILLLLLFWGSLERCYWQGLIWTETCTLGQKLQLILNPITLEKVAWMVTYLKSLSVLQRSRCSAYFVLLSFALSFKVFFFFQYFKLCYGFYPSISHFQLLLSPSASNFIFLEQPDSSLIALSTFFYQDGSPLDLSSGQSSSLLLVLWFNLSAFDSIVSRHCRQSLFQAVSVALNGQLNLQSLLH